MGSKVWSKLQRGFEATPGTAVPATTIVRGTGVPKDERKVEFPPEDLGIAGGTDRSIITWEEGSCNEQGNVTFEQFPGILACGLKNVTTGAADGAGTGKIYEYPLPTTTPNTVKTATLEGGDDAGAEVMAYGYIESFNIGWEPKTAMKYSAMWKGRGIAPQAFTAGLSAPAINEIVTSPKLYIDGVGTYPATTIKASSVLGLSLDCKTGVTQVPTANTLLSFDSINQQDYEILIDVSFYHNAIAIAQIAGWRAQTPTSLKLLWEGAATATAGTTYSKLTFLMQFVGKWDTFSERSASNGNSLVSGKFRVRYNATAAAAGKFLMTAELAALA
ncbi:MAG: hypothetical protein C0391_03920 [Anaerolinea sp.]|nr:hypothetical protein [Anaerolinea sp.]